jgi:hypothetical protein
MNPEVVARRMNDAGPVLAARLITFAWRSKLMFILRLLQYIGLRRRSSAIG